MRRTLLKWMYTLFPFDIHGDCQIQAAQENIKISCVINFYGRLDLLKGILYSLQDQQYPKDKFEVVLVEDRGGTEAGRKLADEVSNKLQVSYLALDTNFGLMGYSRNFGLANTRGEIILFLDDDTVILQKNFLSELEQLFTENLGADAVIPHGHAVFSCIEDKYDFHEPYFMTSRCTAYRRKVLQELCGFVSHFVGQEDVEFITRFTIARKNPIKADNLNYYHPPLLTPNTRKPRAVGFSFYSLKKRYSLPIWLLLMVNCSRHAPLLILPGRKFKEQGRFGTGFLLGVIDGIRGCNKQVYG